MLPSLGVSHAEGQEVPPGDVGFREFSAASSEGMVRTYVSTQGHPVDVDRILPLVPYLQGSADGPIHCGSPDARSNVLVLKPADLPGYPIKFDIGILLHGRTEEVLEARLDPRPRAGRKQLRVRNHPSNPCLSEGFP